MTSVYAYSNDAGIQQRLKFIKTVLQHDLGVEAQSIKPIAYEENFPFPYNNFVYIVEMDCTHIRFAGRDSGAMQHGTQPIPKGASLFIFRLPNPVSGYNDSVRIENEVAALDLARKALHPELSHLVPRVFAWASAANGKGWLLQEFMPGSDLLEDFKAMNKSDKTIILSQMADILGCLQRFELPDSIKQFGGLSYDSAGSFVSAPLSIYKAGPFCSYEALIRGTISSKLTQADADANVQGWRTNSVRTRLEAFLETGLHGLMQDFEHLKKTLVHADFSTDNILYDKESKQLTAVFDFDFAHIGTAADDFFRSLGHGVGRFPDTREDDPALAALQKAMLEDFPDVSFVDEGDVDWPAATAWNSALKRKGFLRPANLPSMKKLADMYWLSSQILPFKLCNPVVAGNSTAEQLAQWREQGEVRLQAFLDEHGF